MDDKQRPCPLCQDLISKKATVCPTCRRSIPETDPEVSIIWTAIGAAILLILWVASGLYIKK